MTEHDPQALAAAKARAVRARAAKAGSGRAPVGKASRLVAAGGAVGVSLGLVGAMAAAAVKDDAPAEPAAAVRRVVVVPRQTAPATPIVVVLPGQMTPSGVPVQQQGVVAQAPPMATAPTPAPAVPVTPPQPVAESNGS